jgi:hypothetical protein
MAAEGRWPKVSPYWLLWLSLFLLLTLSKQMSW